MQSHKFVFTTFNTFWQWAMANLCGEGYSHLAPLMDVRTPPGVLLGLPRLICMPHTARSIMQVEGMSLERLNVAMGRMAGRGMLMLPDWEEGCFLLKKTHLYQQLMDVFPVPSNGELPDVCTMPSVPLQLDHGINVTAIQQVRTICHDAEMIYC